MKAHIPSNGPQRPGFRSTHQVTTRREFLQRTAALAGTSIVAPASLRVRKRRPFAPPSTK